MVISTTFGAVRKGAPGLIEASQIERELHYAERSDCRALRLVGSG